MSLFELPTENPENEKELPEIAMEWMPDGGIRISVLPLGDLHEQGGTVELQTVELLSDEETSLESREIVTKLLVKHVSKGVDRQLIITKSSEEMRDLWRRVRGTLNELRIRVISKGLVVADESFPQPKAGHWEPVMTSGEVAVKDPLESAYKGPRRLSIDVRNPNALPMPVRLWAVSRGPSGGFLKTRHILRALIQPGVSNLLFDDKARDGAEYFVVSPDGRYARAVWSGIKSSLSTRSAFGRGSASQSLPVDALIVQEPDGMKIILEGLPEYTTGIQIFRLQNNKRIGKPVFAESLAGGTRIEFKDTRANISGRKYVWEAVLQYSDGTGESMTLERRRLGDSNDVELTSEVVSSPTSGVRRVSDINDLRLSINLDLTSRGIDRITNILQSESPEVVAAAFGNDINALRSSLSSILFLDISAVQPLAGETINLGRFSAKEIAEAQGELQWAGSIFADSSLDLFKPMHILLTPMVLNPVVALETNVETREADFRTRTERLRRFFSPIATNRGVIPARSRIIRDPTRRIQPILATVDETRLSAVASEVTLEIPPIAPIRPTVEIEGVSVGTRRRGARGGDLTISWRGELSGAAVPVRVEVSKEENNATFSEVRTYLLTGGSGEVQRGEIQFSMPRLNLSNISPDQVRLEIIS